MMTAYLPIYQDFTGVNCTLDLGPPPTAYVGTLAYLVGQKEFLMTFGLTKDGVDVSVNKD